MLKRFSIFTLLIFTLTALSLNVFAQGAEETEPAASSKITAAKLPAGALRVLPSSVPAEISQGLEKMVEAGEGKLVQGEAEVLAWTGGSYRKASAANLMRQIENNLKAGGWIYENAGTEDGLTFFSVLREKPQRSAVLGYFVTTDEALVLAWTEVHAPDSSANSSVSNDISDEPAVAPAAAAPRGNSPNSRGGGGSIVGTWTNGTVSMLSEKNLSTGAISSRGGSSFKYVFNANGTFEFIGLMNSTMYGCTTSLFNDKRGRYEISGSTLTLIPSKNFWRNQYSCSPASNKERDYVLDRETYQFRTKTDEYGATLVCLDNGKGETCYRREK